MKRLWFIAILAALGSACVEGGDPVQLLGAFPRTPEDCALAEEQLIRGRLNFNGSERYVMTFKLFSPLSNEGAEDQTPAGFIGEEIIYNYESRNPSITFTEESLRVHFVVSAGADGENSSIQLNMIATEARKKLAGAVPVEPDSMLLLATIKLKGKRPSGAAVETNEVTYPIEISRAGEQCVTGEVAVPLTPAERPCAFPGQDQSFFEYRCVPAP